MLRFPMRNGETRALLVLAHRTSERAPSPHSQRGAFRQKWRRNTTTSLSHTNPHYQAGSRSTPPLWSASPSHMRPAGLNSLSARAIIYLLVNHRPSSPSGRPLGSDLTSIHAASRIWHMPLHPFQHSVANETEDDSQSSSPCSGPATEAEERPQTQVV